MKISSKRQISIPKAIMDALDLHTGDEVEFEIEEGVARMVPIKTIKIPKDQAWFWTPNAKKKETEIEPKVSNSRYHDFGKLEDLYKGFH